jgi:uncharacterized protein DUF3857
MRKLLAVTLVCLLVFSFSYAQETPEPGYYYKFEEEHVNDFCWKSDDPNTTDTVVPEEWRDESAVFLYFENYYETIRLKSKAHAISYIAHYRIKIQDNSALERFSEIYYSRDPLGNYSINWGSAMRQKNFLSIKIIKPNGNEIVLESENFIKDEDGGKKVAVPNLEVGDIIDYYQYTYDYGKIYSFTIIDKFIIAGNYPIKHFKYQLLTNKHWKVMLTTGPNGPEIKEKKIGKNFYKFSITGSNFDSDVDVMWNLPYFDFPFVKLYVIGKDNFLKDKEKENKRPYRTNEIDKDNLKTAYTPYYQQNNKATNEYNSFLRYLKRNGKSNLTKEQKLEEYYYFLRHIFLNKHYIYDMYNNSMSSANSEGGSYSQVNLEDDGSRYLSGWEFTSHLIYGLNKMKIRYELIATPTRKIGSLSNLLSVGETSYLIKAKLNEPIYFYKPSVFTEFNNLPSIIESAEGYSLYSPDKKTKNISVKKTNIPASEAIDNSTKHEIDITFNNEDQKLLDINTKITYKGEPMLRPKYLYVDKFKMIWEENDRYKTKKWGDLENSKEKRKIQMEEFTESREEIRRENFIELAKDLYDTEDIELGDYNNLNTGNQPGDYDFQIFFKCTAEGLVKKVGPNYVIKAGQLLGGQLTLDDEDMDRAVDIYMNYARMFEYTVTIAIPDGFVAVGLDNFNISIDNTTGSFIASATEVDGTITMKFTKTYKHNFEKVEDWGLMKEFIIPASTFPSKEILLKKK